MQESGQIVNSSQLAPVYSFPSQVVPKAILTLALTLCPKSKPNPNPYSNPCLNPNSTTNSNPILNPNEFT